MTTFDPLDMQQYRIERLPHREKPCFEKWLAMSGPFLAIIAFVLFAYIIKLPFLHSLQSTDIVTATAKEAFNKVGMEQFIRNNEYMLAIFLASIILWVTQAIPNYLTSLMLIITLVLTGVLSEKTAYAQLGHPVMWLNIMSFVLASMLVVTGLAKRFALWLILKFGKNASTVFISFIVINMFLSAFVSATTAKAAILLPIFMVIAAIYGAQG
ncbi:MAG: SLC13 family permease, partial [Bacteroidota bacterium]